MTDGLAQGRHFETITEAVAGAWVPLEIGASFIPAHGHGHEAMDESDPHHDMEITVVGKMPLTGTPWDKVLIVAVESVWEGHGMGYDHTADHSEHSDHDDHDDHHDHLGPPFGGA